MRFRYFRRFAMRCCCFLARGARAPIGLGMAVGIVSVMAVIVLVVSAMITTPRPHQQVAPLRPDMTILHRMMQDQRAIARATRTYTLSSFAERFGQQGD